MLNLTLDTHKRLQENGQQTKKEMSEVKKEMDVLKAGEESLGLPEPFAATTTPTAPTHAESEVQSPVKDSDSGLGYVQTRGSLFKTGLTLQRALDAKEKACNAVASSTDKMPEPLPDENKRQVHDFFVDGKQLACVTGRSLRFQGYPP